MNRLDDRTFEDRLLQGLLDVQADGPATKFPSPWRRAMVPVAVAVAVGGAAVGITVASGGGPGGSGGPGHVAVAPPGSIALRAESIAAVTGHVTNALAEVDDSVMHLTTRIVPTGVRWEHWSDPATGRYRSESFDATGAPMYEYQGDASGYRVVDFADQAWWTFGADDALPSDDGLDSPAAIRKLLAKGQLTLAGHEVVDGHDTVHLTGSALLGMDPATSPATIDLWVDATTYLPVRSESSRRTGIGPDTTKRVDSRGDYTWSARTPSNLAHLTAPVPTGFRHLAGPPARIPATPGGLG